VRAHRIGVAIAALLVVCASMGWAQGWDPVDLWGAEDVREASVPSWFGTTGLVVIPTAEVLDYQGLQVQYHAIDTEMDGWQYVWGANVSPFPGLEAGVTLLDGAYTPGPEDSELVYNLKYQVNLQKFLRLDEDFPMVAIGARDLNDDANQTFYVALTKDFMATEEPETKFALTVGYGGTEISGAPLDGLFAGVDFSPFEFTRAHVEHDGENVNATLRYWWSDWAITEIGVIDGDVGLGAVYNSAF